MRYCTTMFGRREAYVRLLHVQYEDVLFVCVIKKDYDRERLKTMRTTMCEQRMRDELSFLQVCI